MTVTYTPTHAVKARLDRRLPFLSVLIALAVGSVYIAQPLFFVLAERFATTPETMRDLFSGAVTIYALSFFVAGPISDLWSGTRLMAGGGIALALCLASAALATSFAGFATALALASIAAAFVPAAGFALLAGAAAQDRQGFYFGIAIAASIVGITLCRSVSAVLVAHLGYAPFLFMFSAILIGTAVVVVAQGDTDVPAVRGEFLQKYRQSLALLLEPAVLSRLSVGGLLFFGYLGIATYLTFRLAQAPFELATAQIGLINVAGLVAVVGAPGSGIAIRRWGSYAVGVCGLLCAIAGALILWQAQSVLPVEVGLILLFLGAFATQPVKLVELSAVAGAGRRGAVSSLYLLVCLLLGGFASSALGPLWAARGWNGVAAASIGALCISLVIHLITRSAPAVR